MNALPAYNTSSMLRTPYLWYFNILYHQFSCVSDQNNLKSTYTQFALCIFYPGNDLLPDQSIEVQVGFVFCYTDRR